MRMSVIVGGQYGSEAKGHVTKKVVDREILDGRQVLNVRVAGPNAGHSAVDAKGEKWALRSVPIGVVNPSPDARLYIAPGSEIDLPVLLDEIDSLNRAGLQASRRLTVSPDVTMIYSSHQSREAEAGLVAKVGSTGKGIGAARADRIMRVPGIRLLDDKHARIELQTRGVTIKTIQQADLTYDTSIVIEGTQGYGLGLHGRHYPQCTSSDTRAQDFIAMSGFVPWYGNMRKEDLEVWVVARVYPIRVAGNSGYLYGETTWEELGLEPEKTTVTKKIRRVGQWDWDLIKEAVNANGGGSKQVKIALTMVDQKVPGIYNKPKSEWTPQERIQVESLIEQVEGDAGTRVGMITNGPDSATWY